MMFFLRSFWIMLIAFLCAAKEPLLNDVQRERLEAKRELSELQSRLTRQSWISAPELFAKSGTRGGRGGHIEYDYETSALGAKWEQPIFHGGSIWYTFEAAKRQEELDRIGLDAEKKELTAHIYDMAIRIRQTTLRIQKIRLSLENKEEEYQNQMEQFKQGKIGMAALDRTMLELTRLRNDQATARAEKQALESALTRYSDLEANAIIIPQPELMHRFTFLKHNSAVAAASQRAALRETDTRQVYASYLPRVSLYGEVQRENDLLNFERYGDTLQNTWRAELIITLPIDVNAFDSVERARIRELTAHLDVSDTRLQARVYFDKLDARLELLDVKIQNVTHAITYYRELHDYIDGLVKEDLSPGIERRAIANTIHIHQIEREILTMEKTRLLIALSAATTSDEPELIKSESQY